MGINNSKLTATTSSSGAVGIHQRKRLAQNFLLIWVDAKINESEEDNQNTLIKLRSVVNDINLLTTAENCIQFLEEIEHEKVFVIVSGSLGETLVPKIHSLPQLSVIYVFCGNRSRHEQWTKQWNKIQGIYTNIRPICQSLKQFTKECNQDSIPMSFISLNDEEILNQNLKQFDGSFLCMEILKEILIEMTSNERPIKDLVVYCREFYKDNVSELAVIDEFERSYVSNKAIWWYVRENFLYQMLNRSVRRLEGDTIIKMSFFIHDLYKQIIDLHREQFRNYHGMSFLVYRGQGLLEIDFQKLMKSKGGLISFDNFMLASEKQNISFVFAKNALTKNDMIGILFKITVNPAKSSLPFAFINDVSDHQTNQDILFPMHTIFRIGEINQMENNNSLYQVELKLAEDNDRQLCALTQRIRQEVMGTTGWRRLGQLLIKLNRFDKAEELYNVLLEQTSNEDEKALYYNQLGGINDDQRDYEKAIEYYQKAFEIYEKTNPPNYPLMATCYNNIGLVYKHMEEYTKAIGYYEKAIKIIQKSPSPNSTYLITSYNNIGFLYKSMEDYSKALSYLEKALELRQKTLSATHPDIATSCNSIGLLYKNLGEHATALSYYERALEIYQKILPANHSDLAQCYYNIGLAYESMKEYKQALTYYKRVLDIRQRSLPSDHPAIQNIKQSIEIVKNKM